MLQLKRRPDVEAKGGQSWPAEQPWVFFNPVKNIYATCPSSSASFFGRYFSFSRSPVGPEQKKIRKAHIGLQGSLHQGTKEHWEKIRQDFSSVGIFWNLGKMASVKLTLSQNVAKNLPGGGG